MKGIIIAYLDVMSVHQKSCLYKPDIVNWVGILQVLKFAFKSSGFQIFLNFYAHTITVHGVSYQPGSVAPCPKDSP